MMPSMLYRYIYICINSIHFLLSHIDNKFIENLFKNNLDGIRTE